MRFLEKPKNKWGWVRVTGWAVLAVLLVWMILSAGLSGMGAASWMRGSGLQVFSFPDGVGLAIVPLLAIIGAGWLEEQDATLETEQSHRREAEQVAAAQRKAVIQRLHETLLTILPEAKPDAQALSESTRLKISEAVRAVLTELDGTGKGDLLHFLFEQGLLRGEKPAVEWNGADFSGARLEKAQLKGICLEHVDLTKARMNGAHLINSRLSGVNLRKAFLRHADLREAVLAGSNLSGAHLENANLEGADLRDTRLEAAFLMHANLKNCLLNLPVVSDAKSQQVSYSDGPGVRWGGLDQAILVETILPDGRKVTNEHGKEYLKNKEMSMLIDRL